MINKFYKHTFFIFASLIIGGCQLQYLNIRDLLSPDNNITRRMVRNTPLRPANSVVVCRSKQCAPAKLSMSGEYIYNSLLHILENNNHKTSLICQANPSSKTCLENYITLPIKVGMTPAYMYIDSVKISDVILNKGSNSLKLLLNYNVSYNGQTPDCTPSQSLLYVRNADHIVLEDNSYNCKMTSIGTTSVKTLFLIDYIDLDYGFIGGYYSIGLSGPAFGGGSGYMLMRLPKDAYPLSPELIAPKTKNGKKASRISSELYEAETANHSDMDDAVKVYPISKNK